jgi:hypothetical protein
MYASGVDFINEFPAACPAICRDANEKIKENSAFGNTALSPSTPASCAT